jgi:hypothetical protein
MRAKPLSINGIRYKMSDQHDSKFMIRQVKNLHMIEISQMIITSLMITCVT